MQNSIIDAINRRPRLPKYIIMVPDRDLIEAANFFSFGVTKVFGTTVNWLARQIERLIEARREELCKKCPGSIHANETRMIWVKMIPRPQVPPMTHKYKVQVLRGKFNIVIDSLNKWRKNTYILEVSSLDMQQNFTLVGSLNADGKKQFWKELDYHFKRYDRKEIKLVPPEYVK